MKITYDIAKFKKGQWQGVVAHHNRVGKHRTPESQLKRGLWLTPKPMHVLRPTNHKLLAKADAMIGTKVDGVTVRSNAVAMIGVHLQLGHSDLWRDAQGKPLPHDQMPNLPALARHAVVAAEEIYGKDNIAGAVLHCDETAPHVEVYVVPMHEGRLNAKHYVNGPADLSRHWNEICASYRKAGFDIEAPDSGAGLGGAPLDGLAGKAGLMRTGSAIAENFILKRQLARAQAEPERLTAIVKRHGKKLVELREENNTLKVDNRVLKSEKAGLIAQISTAISDGFDLAKAKLKELGAELSAALERIKALDEQVEALKREKAAAFEAGQRYERERKTRAASRQVTKSDESQGLGL